VKFRKETEDGTNYAEPYFSSRTFTITNEYEIKQKLKVAEEVILELIVLTVCVFACLFCHCLA